MSKIEREQNRLTATKKDRKPSWFHWLFLVATLVLVIASIFGSAHNGLWVAWLMGVLILTITSSINWIRNGNIFDNRAINH